MNYIPFELGPSWQLALSEELLKPYLVKLASFVEEERRGVKSVYPPKELVFNAFLTTPYEKVKVVILGQDPYHGAGQAHGLSFSVPKGVSPPPSLKNIFKELESDLSIKPSTNGSLVHWAKQGVLLLNTTLTVRESEPLSHHGQGWEKFTDAVIATLCQRKEPIIFMLWGKNAQEKCQTLGPLLDRHVVLKAPHPSPFSAHSGFFGSAHFSKANEHLAKWGKEPIVWGV